MSVQNIYIKKLIIGYSIVFLMLISCAQDQDILPSQKSDSGKTKDSQETEESQGNEIIPSSKIFREDAIIIEFYQRLSIVGDQEPQQSKETSSNTFNLVSGFGGSRLGGAGMAAGGVEGFQVGPAASMMGWDPTNMVGGSINRARSGRSRVRRSQGQPQGQPRMVSMRSTLRVADTEGMTQEQIYERMRTGGFVGQWLPPQQPLVRFDEEGNLRYSYDPRGIEPGQSMEVIDPSGLGIYRITHDSETGQPNIDLDFNLPSSFDIRELPPGVTVSSLDGEPIATGQAAAENPNAHQLGNPSIWSLPANNPVPAVNPTETNTPPPSQVAMAPGPAPDNRAISPVSRTFRPTAYRPSAPITNGQRVNRNSKPINFRPIRQTSIVAPVAAPGSRGAPGTSRPYRAANTVAPNRRFNLVQSSDKGSDEPELLFCGQIEGYLLAKGIMLFLYIDDSIECDSFDVIASRREESDEGGVLLTVDQETKIGSFKELVFNNGRLGELMRVNHSYDVFNDYYTPVAFGGEGQDNPVEQEDALEFILEGLKNDGYIPYAVDIAKAQCALYETKGWDHNKICSLVDKFKKLMNEGLTDE